MDDNADNVLSFKKKVRLLTPYEGDYFRKQFEPHCHSDEDREVLGNVLEAITSDRKSRWRFSMFNPDHFYEATKVIRCKTTGCGVNMAVFTALTSLMDYDTGKLFFSRTKLCDDLEISSAQLSKSLTELINVGIFYRQKNGEKNSYTYFMNPEIAWYGSDEARRNTSKNVIHLPLLRIKKEEEPTIMP